MLGAGNDGVFVWDGVVIHFRHGGNSLQTLFKRLGRENKMTDDCTIVQDFFFIYFLTADPRTGNSRKLKD